MTCNEAKISLLATFEVTVTGPSLCADVRIVVGLMLSSWHNSTFRSVTDHVIAALNKLSGPAGSATVASTESRAHGEGKPGGNQVLSKGGYRDECSLSRSRLLLPPHQGLDAESQPALCLSVC
ncbi:hypothetical protein L7F22_004667 [Adiantum nelumboides]|nr:hypothetical protein [Adiantum nelumboides]